MSSTTTTSQAASTVVEAVLASLSVEEQPLRAIRAQTAKRLATDPSGITSKVAKTLSKLVADGTAVRPRRGFYRLAQPAVAGKGVEAAVEPVASTKQEQKEATVPKQIARPLAANRITTRPKFVRDQQRPARSAFTSQEATQPSGTKPAARVAETAPQATSTQPTGNPNNVVAKPETNSKPAVVAKRAEDAKPESIAKPAEDARPETVTKPAVVNNPAVKFEEAKVLPEQPATAGWRSRHQVRMQRRIDRKWTPQGTMGSQGMILIILWLVVAGILMFTLNNMYGIVGALTLGVVAWLLHIAIRPRQRRPHTN